jgi:hypothetical protein
MDKCKKNEDKLRGQRGKEVKESPPLPLFKAFTLINNLPS